VTSPNETYVKMSLTGFKLRGADNNGNCYNM